MTQEYRLLVMFFNLNRISPELFGYKIHSGIPPLHPLLPVCPLLMSFFFWNMDKMGSIQHSQPKSISVVSFFLKHE